MITKAVLLDLDETLMPEHSVDVLALTAVIHQLDNQCKIDVDRYLLSVQQISREEWVNNPQFDYCSTIGISPIEGLWGEFIGDNPALKAIRDWVPEYRQKVWQRVLNGLEIEDSFLVDMLTNSFPVERRDRHELYPEVEHVLKKLQNQYRLALITDGASDIQGRKIQYTGLTNYFDIIFISSRFGFGKPNAKIFQAAIDHLGVDRGVTVMVGDNLDRDIFGAKRLGIRAIWINRQNKSFDGISRPDAVIRTLDEIFSYL